MTTRDDQHWCDFCGLPNSAVEVMIAGPIVHICGSCVEIAMEVIADRRAGRAELAPEAR